MFIVLTATVALALEPATVDYGPTVSITDVVYGTPTENCTVPEGDANGDGVPDGSQEKCLEVVILPYREASVAECSRTKRGCVPEFRWTFQDGTSTDGDINPIQPDFRGDLLDGWYVGVGGLLGEGVIVLARDAGAVEAALATGDHSYAEVGVTLVNLETSGVGLAVTQQGSAGSFLVVADPSNDAAVGVPLGTMAIMDNTLD